MSEDENRAVITHRSAGVAKSVGRGVIFLTLFLAFGALISGWWIGKLDGPGEVLDRLPTILAALGLTLLTTIANISLRWIRWHFLVRSLGARLTARDSLIIYGVTLPAILTPFYVGELLRAVLVGRKYPHHRGDVVCVWLLERSCDFLMLLLFAATRGRLVPHAIVFAVLWLLSLAVIRFRFRISSLRNWPRLSVVAVAMSFSLIAWSLTAAALSGVLHVMNSPLSLLDSSSTFAYTTILGSITGVPVGIGIAGSLLVKHVAALGVPLSSAILCTVVFRVGTVWFIVAAGTITIILKWKKLLAGLHSEQAREHFDDIADTYQQRIPEHVRQRLLTRKVRYMTEVVRSSGPQDVRRGLDVGCGHGWYACEMARAGCRMYAVDNSTAQLRMARQCAVERGISVQFLQADAAELPFEDNHFDFAYAINVLHHVIDPDEQLRVLAEIVRVLKPGGVFFLQEVNTLNPLFRFYLGYVFPLIRGIDEGNERWIRPDGLPDLPGATWQKDKLYFTFLPDFIPGLLLKPLSGLESYLEKSRLRKGSAHYIARLVKHDGTNAENPPETAPAGPQS